MTLFDRLRAFACKSWGLLPGQFDKATASREILLADILERIRIEAHDPIKGMGVLAYIHPATIEKKRQKADEKKRVITLRMLMKGARPKNEAERQHLEKLDQNLKEMGY